MRKWLISSTIWTTYLLFLNIWLYISGLLSDYKRVLCSGSDSAAQCCSINEYCSVVESQPPHRILEYAESITAIYLNTSQKIGKYFFIRSQGLTLAEFFWENKSSTNFLHILSRRKILNLFVHIRPLPEIFSKAWYSPSDRQCFISDETEVGKDIRATLNLTSRLVLWNGSVFWDGACLARPIKTLLT